MYDNGEFDDENISQNVVVLRGNVSCAKNLPILSNDERDGRAFFRVLYVEGGSKSTMFRCKTMIFNSDMSADVAAPQWRDGSFRFEMLVPEDEFGIPSLNGEILIAVYRSRWQGGNDFIGQASFDLHDAVPLDMGFPGDIERNVVKGSYELIDRQGRVAGDDAEIEASLEFVWRVPPARPESKPAGGITILDLEPPASVASKTSRATSKKATGTGGIRRIQSAQTARKKAEAMKIELENKALQARIQRSGTKAAKEKISEMYKAQPNAATATATVDKRASTTKKNSTSMAVENKSTDELLALLNSVKTKAASAERENTTLRAQVTKEKSATKRMEADIERVRRQELGGEGWVSENSASDSPLPDPLAIDEKDIADNELREMMGEHLALQHSRRELVKKISQSRAAIPELQARTAERQARLAAAWAQIDSTEDGAALQDNSTSVSLREVKELEYSVALLEAESTDDIISADLNDDRAVNDFLKRKLATLREDLEKANYERDITQDRFKKLTGDAVIIQLQTALATLRAAYYRCQRRERSESLTVMSEKFENSLVKLVGDRALV